MNRQYHDRLCYHSEVDGVRKARQDRPPGFVVHARESERISSNAGEKAIDRLAELLTKTGTSRLVPLARLQRFVFGLGLKTIRRPTVNL